MNIWRGRRENDGSPAAAVPLTVIAHFPRNTLEATVEHALRVDRDVLSVVGQFEW
jgi:hypothetical protein